MTPLEHRTVESSEVGGDANGDAESRLPFCIVYAGVKSHWRLGVGVVVDEIAEAHVCSLQDAGDVQNRLGEQGHIIVATHVIRDAPQLAKLVHIGRCAIQRGEDKTPKSGRKTAALQPSEQTR